MLIPLEELICDILPIKARKKPRVDYYSRQNPLTNSIFNDLKRRRSINFIKLIGNQKIPKER